MRWYAVMGNHDMKVQGTIPDDIPAWRAFVRQWVVGNLKVQDLAPDKQQEACEGGFADPEFWMELAESPGTTRVVPSDPDRRLLDRDEWVAEHETTTGIPVGHGFLPMLSRCREEAGEILTRACYTFDEDSIRMIVLDTAASEGLQTGNIDEAQFAWLERELVAASREYFDDEGNAVENPSGQNRLLVVATHHTISSTENTGPRTGFPPGSEGEIFTGEDLKALLLRFPNVILQVDGHTHRNRLWFHEDEAAGTGYWEVNTASVTDFPHQSRSVEIADNRDGTLSIFGVIFDEAVAPNPRDVDWTADDPTDEVALGDADRVINEDWLASAGREVGFHDPQHEEDRGGAPEDRNVELLIEHPFDPCADDEVIAGTPDDDVLVGTSGRDVVCGGEGDDVLLGGPGDDVLLGEAGNDRIFGGPGDDVLLGGSGDDGLFGGPGDDLLRGGAGSDRCRGGPGTDSIVACES